MAQPTAYKRTKNFQENSADSTDHGALNSEFDAISTTTDQIRTNLALIQSDDGSIKAGSIGAAQLKPGLKASLKGATGDTGPQGPVGPQGPAGPEGPRGPQGDPGASFAADVNDVFVNRSNYDLSSKGTSFLAIDTGMLYWKLSDTTGDWSSGKEFGKGEQGEKGDKGDTGATGPQGPIGATGPQGAKGDTGPAGKDGVVVAIDTTQKSVRLVGRKTVYAQLVLGPDGTLSIKLSSE